MTKSGGEPIIKKDLDKIKGNEERSCYSLSAESRWTVRTGGRGGRHPLSEPAVTSRGERPVQRSREAGIRQFGWQRGILPSHTFWEREFFILRIVQPQTRQTETKRYLRLPKIYRCPAGVQQNDIRYRRESAAVSCLDRYHSEALWPYPCCRSCIFPVLRV